MYSLSKLVLRYFSRHEGELCGVEVLQPVEVFFVSQILALLLITEFQLIPLNAPIIAIDSSVISL